MAIPGVRPGAIKAAEGKPAPRLAPSPRPTRNYVELPRAARPAPRLFSGFTPPSRSFQQGIQQAHQREQRAITPQQKGREATARRGQTFAERVGRARYEAVGGRGSIQRAIEGAAVTQKARPLSKREIAMSTLGPSEFGGGEFDLGKALRNVPGSAIRTVTGIVPALYETGKAGVELAAGKPAAAGRIVTGLKEAALHPGKFATEEPVPAALMFSGGESALSRVAGVSRERSALQLYGDIAKPREYAPSVLRKGLQQQTDFLRERILRQDPNQAVGWRLKRELKGGVFKPGQVDIQHGMGEAMTKLATGHSEDFLRRIKPAKNADQTGLYYEGYIRRPETAVQDAEKRLAQLQREAPRLPKYRRRANEAQQQSVQKFLAAPAAVQKELEGTARVVAREHQPLVHEMVNVGHLEPNQPHAALVPFALEHGELLGRGPLHYEQNPGLSPAVQALRQAAKEHEKTRREVSRVRAEIRGAGGHQRAPSSKITKLNDAIARMEDAYSKRQLLRRETVDMKTAGLIKPNGEMYPHIQDAQRNPVLTSDLQALWDRETNHRPVGFISHKDEPIAVSGGRGFGGGRPGSMIRSRSGEHALSGTYDNSWTAIRREFRKANRNVTGHLNENQLASRFGAGGKDGLFADKAKAEDLARHLTEEKAGNIGQWIVRSVGPDKVVSKGDITHQDGLKILEQFGLPELRAINESDAYGKWSVMPRVVSERIDSHLAQMHPGPIARGYKKWTEYFRHAALYPTPRWPVGVTQENAIRSIAHKVSPMSLWGWSRNSPLLAGLSPKTGMAITDELRRVVADPTISTPEKVLARQHLGAVGLGSMYGQDMNAQLSSVLRDMTPDERTGFQQFQASTGPKQMLEGWESYKHVIGHSLQQMETNAREAGVGKMALDETKTFGKEWRGLVNRQDDLVKEYVKGILEPNKAVKFTEDLFTAYGNWNHLTPTSKFMQKTIAPFGLWWLNSMKFVLKTLPKDHPMGTAVIAALIVGTGANQENKLLPEYAQGNIIVHLPLVGEVNLNPIHYTPFDIARGEAKKGGPLGKATEMLVPQPRQVALEALGLNTLTFKPTGAPWEVSAGRAAEGAAIGSIPFLRPGLEIARGGAKPNEKSLNPLATTGPRKGTAKAAFKYLFPMPIEYPSAKQREAKEPVGATFKGAKPKGFKSQGSQLLGVKPKGFK